MVTADKGEDTSLLSLSHLSKRTFKNTNELTLSSASRKAPVGDHSHVQPILEPNVVHHTDYLKYQHVLTQVISCLNNIPDLKHSYRSATNTDARGSMWIN